MKPTRETLLADTIELLHAQDLGWEDEDVDEITEETRLLSDLNWQSVHLVVLANAVQERYQQVFPFTDLLLSVGDGEVQDITIGQWVDFIDQHMAEE